MTISSLSSKEKTGEENSILDCVNSGKTHKQESYARHINLITSPKSKSFNITASDIITKTLTTSLRFVTSMYKRNKPCAIMGKVTY